MAPPNDAAPEEVVRTWFRTASMALGGADHRSMEGEEEEKRGFGVSFSIRVGLCLIRKAVGVETQEAGAYCPGFQKILVSC